MPHSHKARILIVEDNLADIELLKLAFRRAELDCEMVLISDGGEAMEYAAKRGKYQDAAVPDLAILDLNLPKFGGLEILAEMRKNSTFDDVSVTVLSSSSWERERVGVEALRVDRFITKPSDLDEYLAIGVVVKEMLQERMQARS